MRTTSYMLSFIVKRGCYIALLIGLSTLAGGCATKPTVTPKKALDYGQFALRQLPPEVSLEALQGKRIVIDPGHGGTFRGAIGPNNLSEADVNLGVGLYLWGMLKQAGAEAFLTRVDDTVVYTGIDLNLKKDLQARAELAETFEADLFVSLHHNADVLPDKKKNSLETYFKMSDPGPSLDVGKCIHRQLALSLRQEDNMILPGNFHVLRENSTTAVLGEPSYISHSENAFRLGLAPMQRIEAQAYFLGIADYFSKGVPEIKSMEPEGAISTTAQPVIKAQVNTEQDIPVDPSSIVMLIDGEPVKAEFDPVACRIIYLPTHRLANGSHSVQIALRNVNGNAATPLRKEIEIRMRPAYMLLQSNFATMRVDDNALIRLSAKVYDIDLMPVADGIPVEFNTSAGIISPPTSRTKDGEAVAYFSIGEGKSQEKITVSASISRLSDTLEINVNPDAPELVVAQIFDARNDSPLEDVLGSTVQGPLGYSHRAGYFAVSRQATENLSITFSRRGYEPQTLDVAHSENPREIRLNPLALGVLLGRRFAVDPQFGGEEKGVTGPTGLRASDLNMDVANHLARFLRTCGADVVLTREADETVSALRRVEIAEEFGAEWFISIGHGSTAKPELAETDGAVEGTAIEEIKIFHYPTSLPGAQLAAAIANTVEHGAIASSVAVQPDTSFVLTHTSSPAVRIRGLDLSIPEIEERFRHPGTARNEAYAIYCGILENFGLTENETGEVAVRVLDKAGNGVANALLNLDESFTLQTGARGEFTLYRLTPGNHRLQVFAGGPPLWSGSISIKAGGKLVVTISVSDATAQSTAEAM